MVVGVSGVGDIIADESGRGRCAKAQAGEFMFL